jgi:hypothetical protein
VNEGGVEEGEEEAMKSGGRVDEKGKKKYLFRG